MDANALYRVGEAWVLSMVNHRRRTTQQAGGTFRSNWGLEVSPLDLEGQRAQP